MKLLLYDHEYLSLKTPNMCISQPLSANKSSSQSLATLQKLDPAANRKPYAWPLIQLSVLTHGDPAVNRFRPSLS